MTKSCFRAVPDDRLGVQNDPTCTNIGFSVSALPESACLGKTEYGEKGQQNFHAVTWQSISRDAGQSATHSNHHCQKEDQKKGLHRQKERIHIPIRSGFKLATNSIQFYAIANLNIFSKSQISCFAGL